MFYNLKQNFFKLPSNVRYQSTKSTVVIIMLIFNIEEDVYVIGTQFHILCQENDR